VFDGSTRRISRVKRRSSLDAEGLCFFFHATDAFTEPRVRPRGRVAEEVTKEGHVKKDPKAEGELATPSAKVRDA